MGLKIFYTVLKTQFGWVVVLGSAAGLKRISLPQPSRSKALATLGDSIKGASLSSDFFIDLAARLQVYFSGCGADFPETLDLAGATDFQRKVWEAAGQIPYGKTESYSSLARKIGKPGAARAVGQALGKNPLPIIIPCHRVLRSDGTLGGFTGGLAMKKRLLALEKRGASI